MPFDTWKINAADRFNSNITKAVKMDGSVVGIGGERIGGLKVTRHHLIDIKTLQDFWNKACDFGDMAVIEALALWAGTPPRVIADMVPAATKPRPNTVIQRICWNPFNIVVGPDTTIRPNNPGEREFDYIAFVGDLTVARIEFNIHVKRLRSIEQYIKLYLAISPAPAAPVNAPPLAPFFGNGAPRPIGAHIAARELATNQATINSLISLLKSDGPSHYPALFAMLRIQEDPNKAEMNQVTDLKRPAKNSGFSPDYIPGALLDPALWDPNHHTGLGHAIGPAAF